MCNKRLAAESVDISSNLQINNDHDDENDYPDLINQIPDELLNELAKINLKRYAMVKKRKKKNTFEYTKEKNKDKSMKIQIQNICLMKRLPL